MRMRMMRILRIVVRTLCIQRLMRVLLIMHITHILRINRVMRIVRITLPIMARLWPKACGIRKLAASSQTWLAVPRSEIKNGAILQECAIPAANIFF